MARVALREGLLNSIEPEETPRLIAARCGSCRGLHFPATENCPYCSGSGCETVPLPSRARLYAHTEVQRAPPGYRGRVPYGLGIVELADGIRLVTRLQYAAGSAPKIGDPMHLVLEDLCETPDGDILVGWAFAPVASP